VFDYCKLVNCGNLNFGGNLMGSLLPSTGLLERKSNRSFDCGVKS